MLTCLEKTWGLFTISSFEGLNLVGNGIFQNFMNNRGMP